MAEKRVVGLEWTSQGGQWLTREVYDDGTKGGLGSVPGMYTDLSLAQLLRKKKELERERIGKLRRV